MSEYEKAKENARNWKVTIVQELMIQDAIRQDARVLREG